MKQDTRYRTLLNALVKNYYKKNKIYNNLKGKKIKHLPRFPL